MKPTKRYSIKFQRSYFDVFNELQTDADKLAYVTAILNKSFCDEEPNGLEFVPKLAYESQRHFIEKSLKGWKDKAKTDTLGNPLIDTLAKGLGDTLTNTLANKNKNKSKNKSNINNTDVKIDFDGLLIFLNDNLSKSYRLINTSTQQKYKARLKEGYTKEDIFTSIKNAAQDKFHIDNGFKHLTPEYFSRAKSLDLHSKVKQLSKREELQKKHNYKPLGA